MDSSSALEPLLDIFVSGSVAVPAAVPVVTISVVVAVDSVTASWLVA